MISFRGILAIGVGAMFLVIALRPDVLGNDQPPLAILIIVFLMGSLAFVGGIVSVHFVWRRHFAKRNVPPLAADVYLVPAKDSDDTTYDAYVRTHGQVWCAVIVKNSASARLADGVVRSGRVWADERTGAPLAIAIDGRQLNTLQKPLKVRPEDFAPENP